MIRAELFAKDTPIPALVAKLGVTVKADAQLHMDSRTVQAGDVFIACPGVIGDARVFVDEAIQAGAAAIMLHVDRASDWQDRSATIPIFGVENLTGRIGEFADAWYGQPSAQLCVVAVTGTNGKTSCVQWLAQSLRGEGVAVGTIGTLGVTYPDGSRAAGQLTTPDVVSVHRTLAEMRARGAEVVALEASSIGLDQGRLNGVRIAHAAFTNLSRDHLDYHLTMQAYEAAKLRLFTHAGLQGIVLNVDDPVGVKVARSAEVPVTTFSLSRQSDSANLTARDLSTNARGAAFVLCEHAECVEVQTQVLGAHNIANLLCVAGLLRQLGWSLSRVGAAFEKIEPVSGRLQRIYPIVSHEPSPTVVVDYAHTPDALERVLRTLHIVAQSRRAKLWCVFGCGGNRDAGKRSLMGAVAQKLADRVVVTSDNPRDEAPQAIIADIIAGLASGTANVLIEADRAQAILHAVLGADPEDIVLLAGKGHEAYQEANGQRIAFDDGQWAQAGLILRQGLSVQTDSRKLEAGSVFLALRGENFDGHDYLGQVAAAGAVAAFVDQPDANVPLPQIAFGDTRAALLTLGRAWRKQFSIPIIAVTGSNGKTTTKEMIASILAAWVGEENRLATAGNLNNELGVPLTLLRLRAQHRVAVIELGMNHPGEIGVLGSVTLPTVALVNNAQREHQEFMVSVEAVALENAAVFESLMPGGTKVFPSDDAFTSLWAGLAGQHASSTFGLIAPARVWASDIESDVLGSSFVLHTQLGQTEIVLPVPGMHNVRNALAATACALASGASLAAVAQGLQGFRAANGRMQPHRLADGRVLIDDTYNANPDSVRAAIDVLASLPSPRVLVLGDMGEVGDNGPAMHTEVGAYARARGVDTLLTLGDATRDSAQAFGQGANHCESPEQVCELLGKMPIASLLVKGSRFMRMERVVRGYIERFGTTPGEVVKHAV